MRKFVAVVLLGVCVALTAVTSTGAAGARPEQLPSLAGLPADAAAVMEVRAGDRVMYSRQYVYKLAPNGDLFAYRYCCGPIGEWTVFGKIGSDWDSFVHVTVVDGFTFYAVQPDGEMRWYRWLQPGWDARSSRVIGTGWASFKDVIGDGGDQLLIYGIDAAGNLREYFPPAFPGQPWGVGTGRIIGTGWGNFLHVSSFGRRIHVVDRNHDLRLYLRNAADTGWEIAGQLIGTGWWVADVETVGPGTLIATMPTGSLRWYWQEDGRWWSVTIGTGFL